MQPPVPVDVDGPVRGVGVVAPGFLPAAREAELGEWVIAAFGTLDEDRGLQLPAPALGLGRGHVAMVLFPADHAGDQVFVAFGQCQAAASDASQQILVALARRGVRVQATLPYGRDWFRNWMRRVAESEGAG